MADIGSIITTIITKLVVPTIADIIANQQASGTVITEASILGELVQRGTMQRAKDEAWLLSHPPVDDDPAA